MIWVSKNVPEDLRAEFYRVLEQKNLEFVYVDGT
jgi:hypothetical protein